MQTRQTIAVIGAGGKMGSALSGSLAGGNYRLLLFSNDNARLDPLVREIRHIHPEAEVETSACSHDACWEADIIILAVPHAAEIAVAERIRDVANQKIVVSIANPLNEAMDALTTRPDLSAAEALQALLPNAKVIKAFNSTLADSFLEPRFDGLQADAFIAGNDPDALESVAELVQTAGFNPLIAGDLSASRTLEQMQLLLINLGFRYGYNWRAGWKILHD